MNELYLMWYALSLQKYILIGKLKKVKGKYSFIYNANGAATAALNGCILPFVDYNQIYTSDKLFPFFKNRIIDYQREDISSYLKHLKIDEYDEFEILRITRGAKVNDNFLLFNLEELKIMFGVNLDGKVRVL